MCIQCSTITGNPLAVSSAFFAVILAGITVAKSATDSQWVNPFIVSGHMLVPEIIVKPLQRNCGTPRDINPHKPTQV